jgi:hypothetical protein
VVDADTVFDAGAKKDLKTGRDVQIGRRGSEERHNQGDEGGGV